MSYINERDAKEIKVVELWVKANDWLNSYGGLISTVSFIVSIFIYLKSYFFLK